MSKSKKLSCWVVTEGMAGTENQCVGIAEALNLEPDIKRISLKCPWSFLTPWLELEQSWSFSPALNGPWPDLVLASGRKAIAAARYIKKKSPQTVTVFVQDPRVSSSQFDLVIAPSHDPISGDNVIKTIAAPNRITDARLREATHNFPALSALPGPRIAVLIGGNSKAHTLTPERMREIAAQLKGLSGALMVTTSRRTGAENEAILKQALAGTDAYIWDGHGDNPYFAMLGLADVILVTNDSASMLSEAATTGKPVYMIKLEGGRKRIDQMQRNLIEHGALREFNGALEQWTYSPLRDAQLAAEAIRAYIGKHE
jgi:hypothetical protein